MLIRAIAQLLDKGNEAIFDTKKVYRMGTISLCFCVQYIDSLKCTYFT